MASGWLGSLQSAFGLCVFFVLAWLLSENRKAIKLGTVAGGIALQLLLAAALLRMPAVQELFVVLNQLVLSLQQATEAGTSFVFGYLGGGPVPFEVSQPEAGFILAFRALPLVIVISALTTLLVYWRILPWVVRAFSLLLEKTLHVGGAVGLAAAANVFVGMIEAPLFIRPYLKQLTRSELFAVMCTGMATIAGTVLVLYATILGNVIPNVVAHLLIASIISVPAAISIGLLLVPETGAITVGMRLPERGAESAMDAIATGTQNGVRLLVNITAMLLVLVALVHLVNSVLGLLPGFAGSPWTLQRMLGYLMSPVTWLMGIPWGEAITAGSLMGIKTILNELLAYLQLAEIPPEQLSDRSRLILTYALCGFANFGSLGIMIGGLTTMVPERRSEVMNLGIKSIIGGTLATCVTGAVVGIFY